MPKICSRSLLQQKTSFAEGPQATTKMQSGYDNIIQTTLTPWSQGLVECVMRLRLVAKLTSTAANMTRSILIVGATVLTIAL